MKQLYKIFLPILLAAPIIVGCEDMLEEIPSKQQEIIPTKVEYLDGFLSNNDQQSITLDAQILMSDDYVPLNTFQERDAWHYSGSQAQMPITWSMNAITISDYESGPWRNCYDYMYKANTMLEYLPEVSGTDEQKARTAADAHYWRALNYYYLITNYALPYQPNGSTRSSLGVPIKPDTNLEDFPNRATVGEVYDLILEELTEAETFLKDQALEIAEVGNIMQWRASAPALYALYARVYLTMGDFNSALTYAQKALENNGEARLVNYATEMSYADEMERTEIIYTSETDPGTEVTIQYPLTSSQMFRRYDWKETYYKRTTSAPRGLWLVPSDELIALFGVDEATRELDLRWKYYYIENYSYTESDYRGGMNWWTGTFTPAEEIGAWVGRPDIGPSVAEMYLIKAECQARTGDLSGAEATVNMLRKTRFDPAADASIVDLSFANAENAIKQVLEERRREMPFFFRWNDMARIAGYGEASTLLPATISREFYEFDLNNVFTDAPKTYTFNPASELQKFAFPIPRKDIDQVAVYGVDMKQNSYPADQ
ncbi:MAG: RagB/SusD family nutrient uptake outer membrane protein [Bacteroidales bacterium]|nr:RagB/SusD family nutrient uptake outer membrane protein [Bacteroidales bacterium]